MPAEHFGEEGVFKARRAIAAFASRCTGPESELATRNAWAGAADGDGLGGSGSGISTSALFTAHACHRVVLQTPDRWEKAVAKSGVEVVVAHANFMKGSHLKGALQKEQVMACVPTGKPACHGLRWTGRMALAATQQMYQYIYTAELRVSWLYSDSLSISA